ncbi:glycosyltransferase family 2 protein [Pseudonocardia sp. RS11V-5]|uniref:glycosyltransferase family 2 protein n=1 Tax=Pseudonocardia terrae TaxID=2905831 RepID=UPI001E6420DE|nr:glycosyltransferase family 2 protein [Pseudonocardia terrae]MCE3553465.1 glycosyltransferase family 2 protein [Pseudonocardia terrae]
MALGRVDVGSGDMDGPGSARPPVSVVVATLNERRNIERLLTELDPAYEVVVSDGGSVDGTVDAVRHVRPGCRLVTQGWSRGTSLVAGLNAARGDAVILLAADGSTCPSEVPRMVMALDGADLARGSRLERRSFADAALATVASARLGMRVTDPWCGATALRRSVVPRLGLPDLTGHATEFELLLAYRAAHEGLALCEVPGIRAASWHQPFPTNSLAENSRAIKALFAERRYASAVAVPAARRPVDGVVPQTYDRY